MSTTTFRTLDGLAAALNLPKPYLKQLAERGQIPYLRLSHNRVRFDEEAVVEALRSISGTMAARE